MIKNATVSKTYVNSIGQQNEEAILFLHGSGPGATAFSNWQYIMPKLGENYYCIAPDLTGFGKSHHPENPPFGMQKWMRLWSDQIIGLLNELKLEKVHLVGNSMGGAVSLHLLMEHPERFDKVVLIGTAGAPTTLTPELDRTWGYYDDPSPELMANIICWFSYNYEIIKGDLGEISKMRYEATMQEDVKRSFDAMFPSPRQKHLNDIVIPTGSLRQMKHPFLLIHGLEDLLVNVETSYYLIKHLPKAQMHIFNRCSHWIQVEYKKEFQTLLEYFFEEKW